ncbi:alanine racemase [Actinopolymorpha singaporensis]|uniref:Alanine racemase n=1 Tax=Actinopolymorpha singaporensis TaxID=117157 RepID=A0A1H1SFA1_9ACTN|nr:alanine racemase [Actinopolymorpha singaporensis]SDS46674.1 alanine racemase [Actinopolymorpha singaporensis]
MDTGRTHSRRVAAGRKGADSTAARAAVPEHGDPSTRAEARVDLAAIRANVEAIRGRVGDAAVLAVVKADGYGHGLVPAARAAVDGGAGWLGVATIEEALALRAAGLTAPRILSWLAAPGERWQPALAAGVDVAAYSAWQLNEIAEAAEHAGATARVHLKIDSGLNRGGAGPKDWPALIDAALSAQAEGTVRVAGIWSHLACADELGHPSVDRQLAVFREAVAFAERVGVRPEVRHLANSAATLTRPDTHFDLVRPGLAVYGLSPVPEVSSPGELGLVPAMSVRARLALVKRVPAGEGVSYGHRYVTSTETTLGLVPLGYADGVPRAASNLGPVWAGGRRRTIAGTVCMDQFVLDLGDVATVAGDEVVLFGAGTSGEPTAQDWADATGTISWEIVTRIGARVPRHYVGGGPDGR